MMKKYLILSLLLISISICAQYQLPVIKLNGHFGYDYQEGTVSICYPDGTSEESLTAKIKWRGGTTNAEGKHKRNYKIKFSDDHRFFGMRNDNNWILDAGQADVFRLRNRIATELWNDFAAKPYYSSQEPKALSGVNGQVVEVYLNDEYRGIYSFTECMDRKQMKLKKFDKDGTIHGVLWKSTGYSSSLMNTVPNSYDNSQPMMDVFEAKYPEVGDDLPETDYSILWNAIHFVVNSSDEEFKNQVEEYFDIPVVLDYYLFINLLGAIDNAGKNMYWAVYDKQTNKKITPAVWDLDLTVGSSTLEQYYTEFSSPTYPIIDGFNLVTRLKQLNVDNFNQKVMERYAELRKTFFSPESLKSRYQNYYDILKLSDAAEREESKWSGDTDVYQHVIDFDHEINYICNWIESRIDFLDEQFNYSNTLSVQNINTKSNNQSIYNLNGQRENNHQLLKSNIYIIDGKKYYYK